MASAGRSSSVVLLAVAAVFCVVVRALYAEATAENGHKTIDERVGGAPSVSAALRVRVVQFSRRVAPKKHTETAVELQERFKEAAEEARLGAAEAFLAVRADSAGSGSDFSKIAPFSLGAERLLIAVWQRLACRHYVPREDRHGEVQPGHRNRRKPAQPAAARRVAGAAVRLRRN